MIATLRNSFRSSYRHYSKDYLMESRMKAEIPSLISLVRVLLPSQQEFFQRFDQDLFQEYFFGFLEQILQASYPNIPSEICPETPPRIPLGKSPLMFL